MFFEDWTDGWFCENVSNLILGIDRKHLDEAGSYLVPDEVLSQLKVLVASRDL